MLEKIDLISCLKYGTLAAIVASIPIAFYINDSTYTKSWFLYLGSFFFAIVITAHVLISNKQRGGNESTVYMALESHVSTLIGVVGAGLICFLLLATLFPGYLRDCLTAKVMTDAPANTIKHKTNGLSFKVFMGAILFNFSMGSFVSIILPFYSTRNETRDSRNPVPFHQKGATS